MSSIHYFRVSGQWDYYPFGMLTPGRTWEAGSSDGYRFGFNGQEQVDEVYGNGNLSTALFWEYDTRLGRRWNVDPVSIAWKSPYLTFNNNPLFFTDPFGDDSPERYSLGQRIKNTLNGDGFKNRANKYAVKNGIDEAYIREGSKGVTMFENVRTERIGEVGSENFEVQSVYDETTFGKTSIDKSVGGGSNFIEGFGAGAGSTLNYAWDMVTLDKQAWSGTRDGMLMLHQMTNPYSVEGTLAKVQLAQSASEYVNNIPNMSANDLAYDAGYAIEKIAEIFVTKSIATGEGVGLGNIRALSNTTRNGTTLLKVGNGKNFRIDLDLNHGLHYHRRGVQSNGITKPGQGIGRHRPWEKKSTDKSFLNRF